MKKILFLLLALFSISSYGQADFPEGVQISGGQPTTTTPPFITTTESDGLQSKLTPENIPISQPPHPINYSVTTPTLGGHLIGIDTRLGQIGQTTAGQTNRIYWTGDNVTVNAVDYFASSATGKGSTPSASPTSLVNGDNQKQYFNKDIISIAQPANTISASGTYSGQLSVMVDSDIAQERFTVEVYKTNNLGVPIASGITGAPVGDLGVTVIAILDSGILDLSANALTNITISGVLLEQLTLNTGERVRYHVSGDKVGTAGSNVTFTVYYGSNHSSYYDVPVTTKASGVINDSEDTPGLTTADALDYLNSKIPESFSKIVYVNNNNPNSATIFDLNNPPTVNDDLLKIDVANLYIGLDASTWVYNGSIYVTKVVSSTTSNFYIAGTTTDAGNSKTTSVYRTGDLAVGTTVARATMHSYATTASNRILFLAESDLTPTSGVTFRQGIGLTRSAMEGVNPGYALFGYNVNAQSSTSITSAVANSADTGNVPLILMQGQRWIDSGGMPSSAITRPILGISNYGTRLMTMLVDGKTGFGASSPTGKVDIVTGNATLGSLTSQANGSISFGNTTATTTVQPTITGKSNTSPGQGLRFVAASNNSTTLPVMQFDVRVNNDLDFSTLTTSAFKFTRFETTSLFEILRNGNIIVPTTPTTSAGTYDFVTRNTSTGVLEKITSASVAPINSPIFTGNPTAPTPAIGDNDTSIATTASMTTALTPKITITTAVSITTATNDAGGLGQNGRHVVIDNGANVINITCNGSVTTSYGKAGTGAITFVQGSGRTLVQLSGTAVFNGIAGSTATLWSNGTTDYLLINNY